MIRSYTIKFTRILYQSCTFVSSSWSCILLTKNVMIFFMQSISQLMVLFLIFCCSKLSDLSPFLCLHRQLRRCPPPPMLLHILSQFILKQRIIPVAFLPGGKTGVYGKRTPKPPKLPSGLFLMVGLFQFLLYVTTVLSIL